MRDGADHALWGAITAASSFVTHFLGGGLGGSMPKWSADAAPRIRPA